MNIPQIAYRIFVKGEKGFEPDDTLKSGLAGVVDGIFRTEGKRLKNPTPRYVWEQFAYVIVAIDTSLQNTEPFDLKKDIDAVVGLLHACLLFTPEGKVMLYDTIGTVDRYRRQGIGTAMINKARHVDSQFGNRHVPTSKPKLIAGLKTPEIDRHKFYIERSDRWTLVVNDLSRQMNYVHLFLPNSHHANGFAKGYHLQSIAQYIGDLPLKFVRI